MMKLLLILFLLLFIISISAKEIPIYLNRQEIQEEESQQLPQENESLPLPQTTQNSTSNESQLQLNSPQFFQVKDIPARRRYRISFLLPPDPNPIYSKTEVTLLLDLIPSNGTVIAPHSAFGALPILSIGLNGSIPARPKFSGEGCYGREPCPPEDTITDIESLETRSPYAFLKTRALYNENVTVTIDPYVWRGDTESILSGYRLIARAITRERDELLCPGSAIGGECSTNGICSNSTSGRATCRCDDGLAGRSCRVSIESAPKVERRPSWEGKIEPLKNSAIATISFPGANWSWKVKGEEGRVEVRARVLFGRIQRSESGKPIPVDDASSSGPVIRMIVKKRWANKGTGLKRGPETPTVYDEKAYARLLVQRQGNDRDLYELVYVTDESLDKDEELIVSLLLIGDEKDDEQVVSVEMRRCGVENAADCAYDVERDEGGFPMAVAIALGVVGGLVLLVVILLILCRCGVRSKWGSEHGSEKDGGAWDSVDTRRRSRRTSFNVAMEKVNTLDTNSRPIPSTEPPEKKDSEEGLP